MELHIVISILLDYQQDFWRWIVARTLSKKSKEIVERRTYDKGVFGRRTLLRQNYCMVCEHTNPEVNWLHYCSDTPASQRWISHCQKWPCRASALYSMVSDYRQDQIYVLREPLPFDSDINIPRSDGSVSKGVVHPGCVIKKKEKWYVSVEWTKDTDTYKKLVPLIYYTKTEPKIMF